MDRQPVLIVDDDPTIRETLMEALGAGGYLVHAADSAEAALRKLAETRFAVVLTDMHMPGGASGLQLLSEIRRIDPSIMVVIITGFATLDTSISALKRGAYDFVQKPFKIRDIEAVLNRALDHAQVLRELEEYRKELERRVLERTKELQAFHAEVMRLNELVLENAGELDPSILLPPFLAFIRERSRPDALGVWCRGVDDGWELLAWQGNGEAPEASSLPAPALLGEAEEWSAGPCAETHLLRLGSVDPDGAVLLGFRQRSAFLPEDRVFALWRRELGALLRARRKTLRALAHLPAAG